MDFEAILLESTCRVFLEGEQLAARQVTIFADALQIAVAGQIEFLALNLCRDVVDAAILNSSKRSFILCICLSEGIKSEELSEQRHHK